jgi:hypothetical protein
MGFDGRVERARKAGASLTEAQEAYLAEAMFTNIKRKRMTDAQRGVKKTLMDKWRTALADLQLLADLSGGWITNDDIRRVFDRDALAEIIKAGVMAQSDQERRKYADHIVRALGRTYANEGEEIQIVRLLETYRPGFQTGLR